MVNQELVKLAKLRVRKTRSDALDIDIEQLVETAVCDLRRIGVTEQHTWNPDAIIREAVLTYVKANYGNHPEAERLMQSYDMLLIKIKGGNYFA